MHFPINSMVDLSTANCYKLREGNSHQIPWNHHFPMVFLCFSQWWSEGKASIYNNSHTNPPESRLLHHLIHLRLHLGNLPLAATGALPMFWDFTHLWNPFIFGENPMCWGKANFCFNVWCFPGVPSLPQQPNKNRRFWSIRWGDSADHWLATS